MADAPDTSTYILTSQDTTNLPNSRTITSNPATSNLQFIDSGPGGNLTAVTTGKLSSIATVNTSGFLSYDSGADTFSPRSFTSDGSIDITNPTGVGGNTVLSINRGASGLGLIFDLNGSPVGSAATLDIVPGSLMNVTLSVVNNVATLNMNAKTQGGSSSTATYLCQTSTDLPVAGINLGAPGAQLGIGTTTPASGLDLHGTANITGAATLGSTLNVTGLTTLANLTVAGTITFASLGITGNATVGGTLGVTGATTLAALTAGATGVTTLSTSGLATLANASVTGTATVGGTLGVTGATTVAQLTTSRLLINAVDHFPVYITTDNSISNQPVIFKMDSYVGTSSFGNFFSFVAARGSLASPTATQSGDVIAGLAGSGYGSTVFGNNNVDVRFIATQTFTDANQGTQIGFSVTANNSNTSSVKMTLDQSGFLGIGTTTPAVALDVVGSSALSGNATIAGTLGVTGLTTLADLTVTGALSFTSLSISGNATVGGTLGVTGNTTLTTLSTSGLATLNSTAVTANATVGGTLGVTGISTLAATGVTTLTASGLITGNLGLTVSGANTSLTTLSTSGLATLNSASVTTTLGVTGNTSLSTASTSGLATLNSASVTTTLGVTGTSTLGVLNAGATGVTTLSSSGLATLNSASVTTTLGVTGTSTLGVLNAGATGVTTLTASALITGQLGLTVTGANTSVTTLSTSGLATLNSATVTNDATVSGSLLTNTINTATGNDLSISNTGSIIVSNSAVIRNVANDTSINFGNGNITTKSGSSSTFGGTLGVTGVTTLSNNFVINTTGSSQPFTLTNSGSATTYQYNNYHSNPQQVITFRGARGTLASPTAIQNNDVLLTQSITGYDGSGFGNQNAFIEVRALNVWTGSDHSTMLNIGTTASGQTNGRTTAAFGADGSFTLPVSDSAVKTTTTLWTISSDVRIKTNIVDVEEALPIINALQPRKYEYVEEFIEAKALPEGKEYYGFVADEVELILPDCVDVSNQSVGEIDNIKILNMHNMNILLFKAIQELSSKITDLEAQVASLLP